MEWHTRRDPGSIPPIDPDRRLVAATLIRTFVAGLITNRELEDNWPFRSKDPALIGVFNYVGLCYDATKIQRYAGGVEMTWALRHCARFLESGLPYVWVEPHWTVRLMANIASFATVGLAKRIWDEPPDCWPFPDDETAGPILA